MYYYNSAITTYTPKTITHSKDQRPPSSSTRAPAAPQKQRRRKKPIIYIDTTQCRHDLVRQCAADMGWQEAGNHEPNIVWIDGAISAEKLQSLKPCKLINHFPSMGLISRKVDMARHLNKLRRCFPKEFNFYPQSWISHQDWLRSPDSADPNTVYITKPNCGSQGKGIKLVKHPTKRHFEDAVVQEYVPDPMLVEGYKFDIRIYVLVLSCDPLKILLYQNGLVRLCTEKYDAPAPTNMQSMCTHLTNYSVNKRSDKFIWNEDSDDFSSGSKRDFRFLNQHLAAQGYCVAEMWAKVQDLVVKSVISIQHILRHVYRSVLPETTDLGTSCFELLGFDILIDNQLNPWLLEVNQAPSFQADTPLDLEIKYGALMETMELLGLDSDEYSKLKQIQNMAAGSVRVNGYTTTAGWGVIPQGGFTTSFQQQFQAKREQFESKMMKGFKKIFPCDHKHPELNEKYRQLMNHVRSTDCVYGSPHIPPQLTPVSYSATLHPPTQRPLIGGGGAIISTPDKTEGGSLRQETRRSIANTLRSMRTSSSSPSRRAVKKATMVGTTTKRATLTTSNTAAAEHSKADGTIAANTSTNDETSLPITQTDLTSATISLTSTVTVTHSHVQQQQAQGSKGSTEQSSIPSIDSATVATASGGRKRRLPINTAKLFTNNVNNTSSTSSQQPQQQQQTNQHTPLDVNTTNPLGNSSNSSTNNTPINASGVNNVTIAGPVASLLAQVPSLKELSGGSSSQPQQGASQSGSMTNTVRMIPNTSNPNSQENQTKLTSQLLYLQKLQQQEQHKLVRQQAIIPSKQHKKQQQVASALLEEREKREKQQGDTPMGTTIGATILNLDIINDIIKLPNASPLTLASQQQPEEEGDTVPHNEREGASTVNSPTTTVPIGSSISQCKIKKSLKSASSNSTVEPQQQQQQRGNENSTFTELFALLTSDKENDGDDASYDNKEVGGAPSAINSNSTEPLVTNHINVIPNHQNGHGKTVMSVEEKYLERVVSGKDGTVTDVLEVNEWLDCLNEWTPTEDEDDTQQPTAQPQVNKSKFRELRGLPVAK